MSDNAPEPSDLSPRDVPYDLSPVRAPTSIDGEPHEVAAAALDEYERLLISVVGYAQSVEAMVRTAMMTEALGLPDDLGGASPAQYPDKTYELQATTRANQALGMAATLLAQARRELALPVAESRRAI